MTNKPTIDGVSRVLLAPDREMRVYIAGPMTGIEDYNFPAFNAMAEKMRAAGWHVENPADHGLVTGAEWGDYLRYDIGCLASCEAIMLLPGWTASRGARLEVSIAKELGVAFMYAEGAEHAPAADPAIPLREHCKQCAEVVKTWPEWKQNCLGGAPAVERQSDPDCEWCGGFSHDHYGDPCTGCAQSEVAALQSTIARLEARVAQLESEAMYAAAGYQAGRARIEELESGRGEPVTMDGKTTIREYVADSVPEDQIGDDWTKGYEECKRRIHRIFQQPVNACLDSTAALNGVKS